VLLGEMSRKNSALGRQLIIVLIDGLRYDMEQELSRIFAGHKVDINTKNSLSKYFRDKVIKEMEIQYVETR